MPILKSKSKVIGITLGDPFGIGPEVIGKALQIPSLKRISKIKIIGDAKVLRKYIRNLPKNCSIIHQRVLSNKPWKIGQPSKESARASLEYLRTAVNLLKRKEVTALVTAPVCKESIAKVQKTFIGHTEYLADAFKIERNKCGMMFVSKNLRTIIVTRHLPLKKVPNAINQHNVYQTINLTNKSLQRQFSIRKPKIGVCGLNPHAGEGGTLGQEEIKHIIPAVRKANRNGINARGPFAADTLFSNETSHTFDAIVAMYHDQGLIPVKTLFFTKLVNVTLGLPFIRTSPAHGTAFDIAGQNKANPSSMIEAIKLAHQLNP